MTDFTYDSSDFTAIRVASVDLKWHHQSAAIGAGLGGLTLFLWQANKNGGIRNNLKPGFITPFVFASSVAYFYSDSATPWRSTSQSDDSMRLLR